MLTINQIMNVKVVSSTKSRNNIASILDAVDRDHPICIIARRGKEEHAIVNLDKLEDLLAANDPKYLEEIAAARKQVADGEVFALKDVFGNI